MHFHCLFVFQFNSRFLLLPFFPLLVFAFWMHGNSQASSHLWENAELSQWRIWSHRRRWSQQGRSHSTVWRQDLPYCEGHQTGKCQLLCPSTVFLLNISINNGKTNRQYSFLVSEPLLQQWALFSAFAKFYFPSLSVYWFNQTNLVHIYYLYCYFRWHSFSEETEYQ